MNTIEVTPSPSEEQDSRPAGEPTPEPAQEVFVQEVRVPPPRRNGRFLALAMVGGLAVLAIASLILVYWRVLTFRWIVDFLPYLFLILPSLIALGSIRFKDWDKYDPLWIRWVLIALVITACVGGVAYQYYQREERKAAEARAKLDIEGLKGQVNATRTAQTKNTEVFTKSFTDLSGELGDLKTQIKTEALQKKLASVEEQLKNTQKALNPAKAKLTFTLYPFRHRKSINPTRP
jgi:hypothetical protein